MRHGWKSGDWAIYRKSKRSESPGRRAMRVVASPGGETYSYLVDKFWVVEQTLPDHQLRLRTARGKTHLVAMDDPCLRKPNWLQRLLWRDRFRMIEARIESQGVAA